MNSTTRTQILKKNYSFFLSSHTLFISLSHVSPSLSLSFSSSFTLFLSHSHSQPHHATTMPRLHPSHWPSRHAGHLAMSPSRQAIPTLPNLSLSLSLSIDQWVMGLLFFLFLLSFFGMGFEKWMWWVGSCLWWWFFWVVWVILVVMGWFWLGCGSWYWWSWLVVSIVAVGLDFLGSFGGGFGCCYVGFCIWVCFELCFGLWRM